THNQVSGKRPASLGNEFGQKIRSPRMEELMHLRSIHGLLQNHLSRTKLARFGVGLSFLTNVLTVRLENASAALRTFAHRLLASKIEFGLWLFGLGGAAACFLCLPRLKLK